MSKPQSLETKQIEVFKMEEEKEAPTKSRLDVNTIFVEESEGNQNCLNKQNKNARRNLPHQAPIHIVTCYKQMCWFLTSQDEVLFSYVGKNKIV